MNLSKKLLIGAFGAMSLLAACGDSGSSSAEDNNPASTSTEPTANPVETKVEVAAGCAEITDEADKAAMQQAKNNITDVYKAFGEGSLENVQALSASTKATIKGILDKYPGSCEAQLGYVATIISDIVNNKQINDFLDTLYTRNGQSKSSLLSNDFENPSKISLDLNIESSEKLRGILVSDAQSALASAIPSIDSAISYMTNIANDDAFTCSYTVNDRTVELDRGEFAPVLAALYVAKATLTSYVSVNLNFDDNGSYAWIDSLETLDRKWNYSENAGIKHLTKMLDQNSKFTSVHEAWKSEYKNIPNMIDSALFYVQFGLQYGLEEAKNGLATQENDLYIVGNDETADLSTADAQKIIDSLSYIRSKLNTGFEIPFADGKTIKINPTKWYQNTDGVLKFLPYYVMNDMSKWDSPDGGFYWSTAVEDEAYAQRYMQHVVAESYANFNTSAGSIEISGWDDDETTGTIFMDIYEPERVSARVEYAVTGCTVNFTIINYAEGDLYQFYDSDDPIVATTNWTIAPATIPEGMCKTENGVTQYAVAYRENEVPNILYFTDAKGNKTVTLQELVNGKLDADGELSSYSYEDLRNIIILPDVTFGGVFPDMTVDFFWDEFLPALMEDEEEEDDWDYYYDDDDYYYNDPYLYE